MADPKTRILIADDHALVRDGMRALVAGVLDGVHCTEAADAETLLKAAASEPPAQLALIDLNMPGMEKGFRLAELARRHPGLPVVVISALTSPDVVLTPRMEEVRQLLRQGLSNKRIASQLGLSEGTVKNYMSEIFRALNVSNRTQAAQMDADRL